MGHTTARCWIFGERIRPRPLRSSSPFTAVVDRDDEQPESPAVKPIDPPDKPSNLAFVGNGAKPATAFSSHPAPAHQPAGINDGRYGNDRWRPVRRTTLAVEAAPTRVEGATEVLELRVKNTGPMTALFCEPHPLIDYRTDLFIDNNHCAIPPGEEVFLHIAHAVFDAAFFVGFAHVAGAGFKAVMGGEVEVAGIEDGAFAERMFEHPGLEVVDEDDAGRAAEKLQRILVAGEEVFHGLAAGELHVGHAAVAENHDEKRESAARCA